MGAVLYVNKHNDFVSTVTKSLQRLLNGSRPSIAELSAMYNRSSVRLIESLLLLRQCVGITRALLSDPNICW